MVCVITITEFLYFLNGAIGLVSSLECVLLFVSLRFSRFIIGLWAAE
jgi:hypothetical protein